MTNAVTEMVWTHVAGLLDDEDKLCLKTECIRLMSIGLRADYVAKMLDLYVLYTKGVRTLKEARLRDQLATGEWNVPDDLIAHIVPEDSRKMLDKTVELRVAMATESITSTSLPGAFVASTIAGLEAEVRRDETKKLQRLANLTLATA